MGVKLTAAQIKARNRRSLREQGRVLSNNLDVIEDYIKVKAVKLLAMIANDLLAHTLPMTPYDTGKLRKSGKADVVLGSRSIAVGRADYTFPHNIVDAQIPVFTAQDVKRNKKIYSAVYFNRRNEAGEDIAVWAHETLRPWIPRPKPLELHGIPYAVHKFTGPKYLETAFGLRRNEYERALANITNIHDLESDIKALSRIRQRRRTHYEVDVIELVKSSLTSLGINVGLELAGDMKTVRGGMV